MEESNLSFCHPNGLIDPGVKVGTGTKVWAFAHLTAGCQVGEDCNICDHTFVEKGVIIGNRVTLKCGVYLWEGLEVEDDVFIGPNATFTNDLRHRNKHQPAGYPRTRLLQGCSIGAGAVVLAGLTIGRWSLVGAGAVVTKSVPDHAVVVGNPARLSGWVCVCGAALNFQGSEASCQCRRAYSLNPESLLCKLNP